MIFQNSNIIIKYSFQEHLISTHPYQNEYVSSTIVEIIKPEAFQSTNIRINSDSTASHAIV